MRARRRHRLDAALRWGGLGAVLLAGGVVVALIAATVLRGIDGVGAAFVSASDSVDAVRSGIRGALIGSAMTVGIAVALALPLGIGVALWLEELAPRRRWTTLLDAMVANLAGVPPLLFGLLGLAVFIGAWGLPRSSPLVAGLTLALTMLPIVAVAARGALRAVPEPLREAARGIGASPVQVAFHHVLPVAAPGIVTGAMFAITRALGEVAPLLLIGMNAFIATPPADAASPATVLPMQVFLWSDRLGGGFAARAAAASLALLVVAGLTGGAAAWLRARWEARAR